MPVRLGRKALLSLLPLTLIATPSAAQLQYADQGADWARTRIDWYGRSQGSRLMPLSWLRALEVADGPAMFLTPENMARFRYLYDLAPGATNLPVGFSADVQNDDNLVRTRLRWLTGQGRREPWVGINCSACHSGEITAGTHRLRIDGAPGMGDYQLFNEDLVRAVAATRSDPDKLDRFIARIPGASRSAIVTALDQWLLYRRQVETMNETALRYGFSRVDAFGHIFNQASLFTNAAPPTAHPSDAPVSYPFLWNVPQQTRLQWNGSVPKQVVGHLDVGAVGRNFGEVVGVYGEVITRPHPGATNHGLRLPAILPFRNSVNVDSLIWLESRLHMLRPPVWPAAFLREAGFSAHDADIDTEAAARGSRLYQARCSSCHQVVAPGDLTTTIPARMSYFERPEPSDRVSSQVTNTPPGTDPAMACNAALRTADSGNLFYYQIGNGQRAGRTEPIIALLTVTVQQALETHVGTLLRGILGVYSAPPSSGGRPLLGAIASPAREGGAALYPASLPDDYRTCVSIIYRGKADKNILGYKARPLNGIWATGPYLHNGAVSTLYDLLLPPADRPKVFWVGSREFDPHRVGFRTEQSGSNSFAFRTHDPAGNPIWGNWNGGHDYGNASLSDRDRWDLVEYLKTL